MIKLLNKSRVFPGLLLCTFLVSASAMSHARERVTLSPSKSSAIKTHFITVGACLFRLKDSLGGKVRQYPEQDIPSATYDAELKRSTLPNALIIDFLCDAKGQDEFCRRFAGLEKRDGHWVQWRHPDPDYGPPPEAHFTVREMNSINGIGATSTKDDTIGDEKDRVRRLSVCLISPGGNALIGKAVVDSLYGNHRSTEPEVRKLLESIEFIENR
ncbi:hypothetical protein [Cupriavidus oxalaticus]|uniref:hypothetical protein n=1 Tax=Cupriavidus oxalaticus TaxID=96344 RepID=UPI00317A6A1C